MSSILKLLLPTFVGLTLAIFSPLGNSQVLNANSEGRVEFASFTPRSMFDLARENRRNWVDQTVWGDLSFPRRSADKVPAVVLVHGSGGIEGSMAQWVDALNDIGVATFVIHIFEARGVKRTAEDQSLVPYSADLSDALHALKLLAGHPRIDANRIGVMGFSRGGGVVVRSAIEPLRRAIIKEDLKFAFHIAVYAGCNQVYWSPQTTKSPMLFLVGADDDATPAEQCEELAKRYALAGAPVRTIKYENASHSWDAMYKVFFLPNATSSAPCGMIRWDIERWQITAERSRATLDPTKLGDFFRGCLKRGYHAGRDERAFRKSREDVQNFVKALMVSSK